MPHSEPQIGNALLDAETERLYSRGRAVLRPALAGRLGSLDGADDILHEAFVRLLQSYSGKVIVNPLALLTRIAMNILRDRARAESVRRRLLVGQDPSPGVGPPPHTPETLCADRQELARLKDAIDRLPPRCREAFLLHRLDGMPHAEVAATLGISRSAVEKHLARAEAYLRRDLLPPIDSGAGADA